jgi:DNA repair protein RadC
MTTTTLEVPAARARDDRQALRPPTLKELPPAERPRERLLLLGEGALSDAELLGLIIGSGKRGATAVDLGRRLVARFDGLRGLARPAASELAALEGIGLARAARLRACLEIARRVAAAPLERGARLDGAEDVFRHFGPLLRDLQRERFYLVLLDRKQRIILSAMIAEGSLSEATVHPREAFAVAIRESAASVLAVHNHPSGDPTPSPEDIQFTARFIECGDLLGIPLVDHVIVGATQYVSLRREGLMIRGP